jgi:hypothetical protein
MDALGTLVSGGTKLAAVVNVETFEELELLTAPFDRTIVMLARGRSRIHPGDYAYICGDATTAEPIGA